LCIKERQICNREFHIECSCPEFYDLPTTISRRAASFGISGRKDLGKKESGPPPNSYKLPSDFDLLRKKGRSFGISRDAYAKVYAEAHPISDQSVPGPGSYHPKELIGNESLKFSIRAKVNMGSNI
jgi:hypothetical protein